MERSELNNRTPKHRHFNKCSIFCIAFWWEEPVSTQSYRDCTPVWKQGALLDFLHLQKPDGEKLGLFNRQKVIFLSDTGMHRFAHASQPPPPFTNTNKRPTHNAAGLDNLNSHYMTLNNIFKRWLVRSVKSRRPCWADSPRKDQYDQISARTVLIRWTWSVIVSEPFCIYRTKLTLWRHLDKCLDRLNQPTGRTGSININKLYWTSI